MWKSGVKGLFDMSTKYSSSKRVYNDTDVTKKVFSTELISSLDRCVVQNVYCGNERVYFGINYNKYTSALQFQLDKNVKSVKQRLINVKMFRNLEKSEFCNIFFKLCTINNNNSDYRCKFISTNPRFDKHLIPFTRELYDFNKGLNSNHKSNNYMAVSGWKLQESDNDLIFFFVERRCYSDIAKLNIVRTAGLQIATDLGLRVLTKFQAHYDNDLRKVDAKKDIVPDFDSDDENEAQPLEGDEEYEYYDDEEEDSEYSEEDVEFEEDDQDATDKIKE